MTGSPLCARLTVLGRRWLAFCWLIVVWVALWGDLSLANVLGGAAVAVVVGVMFPLPPLPASPRFRPWNILVLVVTFLWDLVVASFHVAWLAWRPGPPPKVAVVRTEVATTSEATLTMVAELTSLVPGTIVLETDSSSRRMYLHSLDVESEQDLDRVRRRVREQDRRVRAAFSPPERKDA